MDVNNLSELDRQILSLYHSFKEQFPIDLCSSLALDDGFTADVPVIVGKSSLGRMYLYAWDWFVFDLFAPRQDENEPTEGCPHWHPLDYEDCARFITAFMQGQEKFFSYPG